MSTFWVVCIGVFFFYLGGALGFFLKYFLDKHADFTGVIWTVKDDDKIVYSLELYDDPELIQNMNEVVFKVMKGPYPVEELDRK